MAGLREPGVIPDFAEKIGVLNHDTGGVAIDEPTGIFVGRRVLHRNLKPDKPPIGLTDLAVMRVKPARQHGLTAASNAVGHHHRLGAGGRPVIERRVRNLHPGQQRDLGLKLEQILQRAL